MTVSRWYLPAGSTTDGPFRVQVTPDAGDSKHVSLRVFDLPPGAEHTVDTDDDEMLVLPLAGAATVTCDGARFELAGRPGVFAAVSDFVYLPRDARAVVASEYGGRFALPAARCGSRLEARYGPAADVGIELRGAGACSRQVNDLCMPATFAAERLLVCEVLTPAGNWSSYPPHKHDDAAAGESVLEEIYYFEIASGPAGHGGTGFQRVYGPGIDVLAEVRDGDVVLVPHGWHGPSVAAPGYDMYYLNVMAGPGPERAWRISTDPDHAWVRDTWASMSVDPRLPMTGGPL
ncbi:MAG TPA: 5-deoxy-glucuronate isomerase [Jiangellaceae bacterium]